MSEPITPLPADHAFVLQLRESQGCPQTCPAGRVEHLSTGHATRFSTTTELWEFVDRVLTALSEHREQSLRLEFSEKGFLEDDS